jgi:hypothetical protein
VEHQRHGACAAHHLHRQHCGEGGGVNTYGSSLEMRDVNLIDNVANGTHGGGLYHSGGTVFITNATISGNRPAPRAATAAASIRTPTTT